MKTSRLQHRYFKMRSGLNKTAYVKQWNYCVSFQKKKKKYCYADLSENDVADQKHFCKTV